MSPLAIVLRVLILLINIYELILLARIILSWFRISPYDNQFVRVLYDLTEPVLEPIRAILPPIAMIDFSPLVVFLLLVALRRALGILATGL